MKKILLFFVILALVLTTFAWIRYGGGDPYPDLSTPPLLNETLLEEVLSFPQPIGNVAVSTTGRVFFTVHPEARPQGNKLLEFVDGASIPFPDGASQARLFDSVLGVVVDRFNRLWTIDHGNHGIRSARLLAFDLDNGELVHDQRFAADIAPGGSFLQDLQVSADGRTVVIADASFWRKKPAIIVYDIESASARRVLESHLSVSAEKYLIRSQNRPMSFAGGIVSLRGGVDGIALGEEWLYYGALSGPALYRIRLRDLTDPSIPDSQIAARVERYTTKPLSDGLSIDVEGNVYITDVEHSSIFQVDKERELRTLIRSSRVRWPDALSFGPDGWLYVADSALADVILQSQEHIRSHGPYKVFRFQPGTEGIPGQ
ncbi:MAG: major royal jelly family protein [Gammaproteobacteria bacterium]|nr:major royal jelly family protein [Gammaproteobacteria bacterium]MDH3749083.1 major royal jelly family protein [Gammaproteobacteria bacterium]MDH3806048.1 major royal jelly family protein [Gammaproteobacteria bacterium]